MAMASILNNHNIFLRKKKMFTEAAGVLRVILHLLVILNMLLKIFYIALNSLIEGANCDRALEQFSGKLLESIVFYGQMISTCKLKKI